MISLKKMLPIAAVAVFATNVQARENISIVGSSTVYPFATVVAEQFGRSSDFGTPKVESTGSGGGLKLFCSGIGVEHPDITNASRRIKQSEVDKCQAAGIEIVEVKIGYDGIVLANSKSNNQISLSRKDIFIALAKDIPGPDGKLIPNPNKTWKDVNPDLPAVKIEVLGPPPTSGTRDAFNELALGGGAKKIESLATLRGASADEIDKINGLMSELGLPQNLYDSLKEKKGKDPKGKDLFKAVAHAIREDGAFIEAGENDNLIVQKLEANPNALGVFGFSFLDQNSDKVQGSMVDGIEPTFEAISDGSYPVSRPLYFYVKKNHVGTIPGIEEYLAEFTHEKAWGEEGYLTDRGLIPMPDEERSKFASDAKNLSALQSL